MTFLNKMSQFLKSDFKLHPSCFLDNESDEHTSLEQRKENQRVSKALRRLYPTFDIIWEAQMELQLRLKEIEYLEKSIFNEHGLKYYFTVAGQVAKLHSEFIKLIKKHSNEPIIKEYYDKFNEFNKDIFSEVFNGDIQVLMMERTEDQFEVSQIELVKLYKGN